MRPRARMRRGGAAAVEFAFLLPFLLFLAVIGVDWARLLYYTITLDNCARSAALVACDQEAWYKSPANPGQTPYPAAFPGTPDQQAVVAAAARLEAPSLTTAPTVVASSVANGGDGYPAVAVTVSMPFQTITRFSYGKMFGVSNGQILTRTVQMRIAPQAPKAP